MEDGREVTTSVANSWLYLAFTLCNSFSFSLLKLDLVSNVTLNANQNRQVRFLLFLHMPLCCSPQWNEPRMNQCYFTLAYPKVMAIYRSFVTDWKENRIGSMLLEAGSSFLSLLLLDSEPAKTNAKCKSAQMKMYPCLIPSLWTEPEK